MATEDVYAYGDQQQHQYPSYHEQQQAPGEEAPGGDTNGGDHQQQHHQQHQQVVYGGGDEAAPGEAPPPGGGASSGVHDYQQAAAQAAALAAKFAQPEGQQQNKRKYDESDGGAAAQPEPKRFHLEVRRGPHFNLWRARTRHALPVHGQCPAPLATVLQLCWHLARAPWAASALDHTRDLERPPSHRARAGALQGVVTGEVVTLPSGDALFTMHLSQAKVRPADVCPPSHPPRSTTPRSTSAPWSVRCCTQVGRIIGRAGATIRELEQRTGTRIQVRSRSVARTHHLSTERQKRFPSLCFSPMIRWTTRRTGT